MISGELDSLKFDEPITTNLKLKNRGLYSLQTADSVFVENGFPPMIFIIKNKALQFKSLS